MPRTRELLAEVEGLLARSGVSSPRADAELLLAHVTGRSRGMLALLSEVTADQAEQLARLVTQRAARVPLQHLTGRAPFRHLEVSVGPGVFVPRPETELLVDAAVAHVRSRGRAAPPAVVVDLCTGSAALALALATELPGSAVHAVELSEPALAWAARNAAEHSERIASAGSVVHLVAADATTVAEHGRALAHLAGAVDVVVCNPPYVPSAAVPREPEVRDHDPGVALFGGPDGLAVIRPLARQAALLLRGGGLFVVEHADVQGEQAGRDGVPSVLRAVAQPEADPVAGPEGPEADPAARRAGQSGTTQGSPGPLSRPQAPPELRPHPGRDDAAFVDVTDHVDLSGLPRYTTAVRRPPGRAVMQP